MYTRPPITNAKLNGQNGVSYKWENTVGHGSICDYNFNLQVY